MLASRHFTQPGMQYIAACQCTATHVVVELN
jgi:hypothetical protein